MAVIYLNRRRKLTEEQKRLATVALSNEINDVMADLEILEEELDKTVLFSGMDLRKMAIGYLGEQFNLDPDDDDINEELLKRVYDHYFRE